MGLADVLTLMVTLMDVPEAAAFADRERLTQIDDAGVAVDYFQTETAMGTVSVTVGAEKGQVVFLGLVGETDPLVQIGQPSVRWVDVELEVLAWIEDFHAGASIETALGSNGRELFILDDPTDPLRVAFGPSFPTGEWNDDTRALHGVSYRVSPETVTERTVQ